MTFIKFPNKRWDTRDMGLIVSYPRITHDALWM